MFPSAKSKKSSKHPGILARRLGRQEGYATSLDGTKIHYQSMGKGLPIVLCNGMGVDTSFWKYLCEDLKEQYQVICWDYRGHGQSKLPQDLDHSDIGYLVQDCLAVTKALKINQALYMGHSLGTAVIFELYRQRPQQVLGLVSCFGTFGRPMDFFYDSPLSRPLFEIFNLLGSLFPEPSHWLSKTLLKNPLSFQLGGLLKLINTKFAKKADMEAYIEHITSRDPLFFSKLSRHLQNYSSENFLDKIKAPTLIIAGEDDTFTPAWISEKMHRIIPKSELLIIRRGSHAALIEQPELIHLRVEKFIRERLKK